MQEAGAAGVTLFNRFYQPDIDLETLEIKPKIHLSTSQEALERIRWVAILRQHVSLSLAITGGVHSAEDALKGLLAGADACCLASALIENGPEHVEGVLKSMRDWMEEREYESVNQLKGSLSYAHAINPADYERANYLEVLDSYSYARSFTLQGKESIALPRIDANVVEFLSNSSSISFVYIRVHSRPNTVFVRPHLYSSVAAILFLK